MPPILSDVCAFDLRAYSPTASVDIPLDAAGDDIGLVVEPSDLGYSNAANLQPLGAYVDLGFDTANAAARSDEWFIAGFSAPVANVWDTWTPAYESDGIDQDGLNGVDQATNGVNNGGSNVIDDPGERETSPPYLEPIRGMKVTLRLVEKGTKQVHQVSIVHSFVPE